MNELRGKLIAATIALAIATMWAYAYVDARTGRNAQPIWVSAEAMQRALTASRNAERAEAALAAAAESEPASHGPAFGPPAERFRFDVGFMPEEPSDLIAH